MTPAERQALRAAIDQRRREIAPPPVCPGGWSSEHGHKQGCRCPGCVAAATEGRRRRREASRVPCIGCGAPVDRYQNRGAKPYRCRSCAAKNRYLPRGRVMGRPRNEHLTAGELDVLRLEAEGLQIKQIAPALHIARSTVRDRLRHAREKLDARTTTHAVVKAYRQGLL